MKSIYYKGKFLKEIDDNEAREIIDYTSKRKTHIDFKGELLKTNQIEIRNTNEEIKTNKTIYQMNTEELKEIIGDFENEYEQHKTGDIIHNEILGDEFEGIIEWAIGTGAIGKNMAGNLEYWFINQPVGIEWRKKRDAMRELQERRRYAKKKTIEGLE